MLTLLVALGLINLGGLVTSHGVGMAVADWPNTYGYNMFTFPPSQWVGGIFYEHTHRLAGSLVGFLTLVLALWLHGRPARRWLFGGAAMLLGGGLAWMLFVAGRKDWALLSAVTGAMGIAVSQFWPSRDSAPVHLRRLGKLALVLVIGQGILGGLRVVWMRDSIGVPHAIVAQLFLGVLGGIVLLTSSWWMRNRSLSKHSTPVPSSNRRIIVATTCLIFLQLAVGATMRHRHSGLAVPDFPLAYGRIWPSTTPEAIARYNRERPEVRALNPLTAADIWLHMLHRATGLGILGLLVAAAWVSRRSASGSDRVVAIGTSVWLMVGIVQVLLGMVTVWTNKSADIATAHVTVGSLLLLGGVWLSMVACSPRPATARRNELGELAILGQGLASGARSSP